MLAWRRRRRRYAGRNRRRLDRRRRLGLLLGTLRSAPIASGGDYVAGRRLKEACWRCRRAGCQGWHRRDLVRRRLFRLGYRRGGGRRRLHVLVGNGGCSAWASGGRGLSGGDGRFIAVLFFLTVLVRTEQRSEEIGFRLVNSARALSGDERGRGRAVAALFDVGERKCVAGERTAVRGHMNSPPVGEDAHKLLAGHARPMAHAAGIQMDKG